MNHDDPTNAAAQQPCMLIDQYLVGDLAQDAAARFERHVAGCAECREAIDEQRWIDGLLQSPEAEALETAPATVTNRLSGQVVRFRRRTIIRRSMAVAAAASIAATALWQFVASSHHERQVAAPGFVRGSNNQAGVRRAATPRQSQGLQMAETSPSTNENAATFMSTGDAIAVPVASDDAQVSIVKIYPTTSTERRWRRELSLNAGVPGQDGG